MRHRQTGMDRCVRLRDVGNPSFREENDRVNVWELDTHTV